MRRAPLLLSLSLLVLLAAVVGLAALGDYLGRESAPESVVRRYFAALEAGDAPRALDEIAPSARDQWSDFVANGVLNSYRIKGIAVQVPSMGARLTGTTPSGGPQTATVFLEITQWVDGVRWQATPRVPLALDRRWYLERPPLAPAT